MYLPRVMILVGMNVYFYTKLCLVVLQLAVVEQLNLLISLSGTCEQQNVRNTVYLYSCMAYSSIILRIF